MNYYYYVTNNKVFNKSVKVLLKLLLFGVVKVGDYQVVSVFHDTDRHEWLLINKLSTRYRSGDQVVLMKIVATEHDTHLFPLIPLIPRGHFMYKSSAPKATTTTTTSSSSSLESTTNTVIEKQHSNVNTVETEATSHLLPFEQQPNISVAGPFPIGFIAGKVIGSIWPLIIVIFNYLFINESNINFCALSPVSIAPLIDELSNSNAVASPAKNILLSKLI
ncbi:hypothetical protein PPL_06957 [Heterostelium album PN500]|uniref:Uncharacterized protein n=1 Tax=Heterostelium pallidum (strain ATCC 26659 / Pp 5 / PN500) TaxID=670386 RepID=D3BE04_HETP5|nr:hypothetical protein PPL_06957 [Heterostelium album PN500]EFA80135.1 hypothetical protein PPL_06957 [Heterostelium album PN500]|eukprot:XP_020432255.1 hypothetical protein PPL_06957 [Heterostelium album PN500]